MREKVWEGRGGKLLRNLVGKELQWETGQKRFRVRHKSWLAAATAQVRRNHRLARPDN